MIDADIKEKIKKLEKIIIALDTAFEKGDDCINPFTNEVVLDNEYDALKTELFKLCPDSKIFTTVTASKSKMKGERIIHDPPMTSISKCNGTEEEKNKILSKFFEDCRQFALKEDINSIRNMKSYPGWLSTFFTMSLKHDGLALSCEYEKGELKRVGLRSKSGIEGINVIDKAKYIDGIPQKLPKPITCKIRGEVETTLKTFNRVNATLPDKEQKANPRAYTAGSMGQKTAEKMKNRGLRFTAYNVVGLDNPPYKTEIERAKWASRLGFHFVKIVPFTYDMLKTFEDNHRRLDFMVDGAVISVGDLKLQEKMGNTGNKLTGNPKGKIAYKFKDEIKDVTVKDITWKTGRTGNITPVLIFDGIQLEGTTVTKCTAHNLGIIKNNSIGIGSKIAIIKSGKIIPKIHEVIEARGSAHIPTICPSCNLSISEVKGSDKTLSLVCNNDNCPAQNIKNFNHWMKTLGVKGVAENTIKKLIDTGVIQRLGDFYRLTVDDLLKVGFTKRTAVLIVSRIWMIKSPEDIKDDNILISKIENYSTKKIKIPISKFFAAFGMKNSGKEMGRILEAKIGEWDKIKELTESELVNLDGVGPIMAKEVSQYFKNNKDIIEDIEQYFLFDKKKASGKFEGQTFVLSGSLDKGKEYWRNKIEERGGIIKSSVSKKINYLVASDGSGSKSDKAKKLNIPILSTEDLEKMI